MANWWRRSFKLRLTLWYAVAMCLLLAGFAFAVYEVVEHRLAAELERQLRIDFDVVEAQIDMDASGQVRWSVHGAHGDEGFARLFAWFEVWSEQGALLFRHWPVRESEIKRSLPPPGGATLRFYESELEPGLRVRLMERPARIGGRGVVLRMFRDQSSMEQTLRQIIEVFVLALPFAVALASFGGYLLARSALAPVTAMTAKAKRITSESLEARLPNPNPLDEFGQLAMVINETLARLESSFTELKRFSADASHELRTPLTALCAVGEVALRQPADAAVLRDSIGSMLEEAQRLTELCESLLTLARMESARASLAQQPVKLAELAREVRDSLAVLAADKRQTIEVTGDSALTVVADRTLSKQALMNILHNAIRYSPVDRRVTLRVGREHDEATIDVIDEGPGIDTCYRERVFDRFFRVDPSRSRGEGGHGLGLAIARLSIERQGGRIELSSEMGQGSTFRICLPLSPDRL